eukprot:359919-Chlamydomonas_euryale.AAC.4
MHTHRRRPKREKKARSFVRADVGSALCGHLPTSVHLNRTLFRRRARAHARRRGRLRCTQAAGAGSVALAAHAVTRRRAANTPRFPPTQRLGCHGACAQTISSVAASRPRGAIFSARAHRPGARSSLAAAAARGGACAGHVRAGGEAGEAVVGLLAQPQLQSQSLPHSVPSCCRVEENALQMGHSLPRVKAVPPMTPINAVGGLG